MTYARKPRARRVRKARKNSNIAVQGAALPVGSGPELVVFPINPISLRWASEVYLLQRELATYQQDAMALLRHIEQVDPGAMDDLSTNEGLDETGLASYLLTLLTSNKNDAALLALAKALFPRIGLLEELKALQPMPSFGVLQGQGVLDAGFTPGGSDPQATFKDRVLSLDQKVQRSRVGVGYPVEEMGRASDRVSAVFLAMGPWDDLNGMALLPPGPTADASARVAAGLVRAILVRRLWDVRTGEWAPGSKVYWALPQPALGDRDLTSSKELADFVCTKVQHYQGTEISLALGFSFNGRTVSGVLQEGQEKRAVRGLFDSEDKTYGLDIAGAPASLRIDKGGVFLRQGSDQASLKLIGAERVCPGAATSFLREPAVIGWLRSGVDVLRKRPSQAEVDTAQLQGSDYDLTGTILSQLVGRPLNHRDVEVILGKLHAAMKSVPMGFIGQLSADDGVPRYLPAASPGLPSWYGASPENRALASVRMGKRVQLSGVVKERPPALLVMQLLAERGHDPYAKNEEAIRMLREQLTMKGAPEDAKERRAFDKAVWAVGTPAGEEWIPPAALRLEGDSAICSAAFSLYGLNPSGVYNILWQSPVMSLGQIEQIIYDARQSEGPTGPDGEPFHPIMALRLWLAERSGLLDIMDAGEKIPVSPLFVGAILVDQRRLAKRLDRSRLGKPLDLGQGTCNGRQTQLGLMLAQIEVPPVTELLEVHSFDKQPDGLVPAKPTTGDYWTLTENFVQIGVTQQRTLLPLKGTPWAKSDLFSPANIERTKEFARLKDANAKKAEPKTEEELYLKLLQEKVIPMRGGAVSDAVQGGRRAFHAFGGSHGRAVKEADKGGHGRLVSQDPNQRQWATKTASFYMDVFNFAASVCRQTGCSPHGPRRTEVDPRKKQWRAGLENIQGDQNVIVAKMAEYGILVDFDDPVSVRDGLVKLRNALQPSYQHKTDMGLIPDQLRQSGLALEGPVNSDAGDEGIEDFAQDYMGQMARLNGRRPRKARKPRRARHNPLGKGEVEELIAYSALPEKQRQPGELPRMFDRLSGESPPANWPLTGERVDEMFPRKFAGKETWRPASRLPVLETHDLVSRVGELDPQSDLVRDGRAAAVLVRDTPPTDDEAVRALMLAEAGLSLDEALRILAEQQGKKSAGFTMTPSSAICKMYRSRKLTMYMPPPQVMQRIGDRAILLWMSPTEVNDPRVMSFRRGTHIDCDMTSRNPEALPELLGRALQSAMFWMVEKPRRLSVTDVWVGRVGQPDLYLALRRQDNVSLAQAAANLDKAKAGVAGYRVPIYATNREFEQAKVNDIAAYRDMAQSQIGPEAARERDPTRPPPARKAEAATPAETAPVDPFGFTQASDGDILF